MTKGKLIVLSLAFFISLPGWAGIEGQVVKVSSYACADPSIKLNGSGLLFNVGDKSYVLTSEHVVFHSNASYCHRIFNDEIAESPALLKIADWSMGLALLELNEAVELPTDAVSPLRTASKLDTVYTYGFPAREDRMLSDQGSVLTRSSARASIPLVGSFIETINTHGEYGMSGGPILDADDAFVGVLSHQYISLVPGRPATTQEFRQGRIAETNHILSIPAHEIKPWLLTQLYGDDPLVPQMVRQPQGQWQNLAEKVITNDLLFYLLVPAGSRPCLVTENDEGEIGGMDGAGAGGSDSEGSQNGPKVQIELSLEEMLANWPNPHRQDWFKRIKKRLLQRQLLQVHFFVESNGDYSSNKKIYFCSLGQFFRLLNDKRYEPVTVISGSEFLDDSVRQDIFDRLKASGNHLKRYSASLAEVDEVRDSHAAIALIRQLHLLGDLLALDNWQLVNKQWNTSLQRHEGWRILFATSGFDHAREALTILLKLDDLLDKVKT